jgi:hypothetical protein
MRRQPARSEVEQVARGSNAELIYVNLGSSPVPEFAVEKPQLESAKEPPHWDSRFVPEWGAGMTSRGTATWQWNGVWSVG